MNMLKSGKNQVSYYRPDIDGLRAVAVLAGLLFQAQVPGFTGGFVSVDIFFVISGFLIASIILRQIQEKKFSFATFYLRRFRRILPALTTMMAVTVVLGWIVLLPEDFKLLGRHMVATVLGIPNISIWEASSDYFAPTVDANPLLDLWSLGVEEQFYLVTPGLLFILMRYISSRWVKWILASALLCSLGLAIWLAVFHKSVGYYWSPPRAWELLCGVGLAYYHFTRPIDRAATNQQSNRHHQWLAVVGLTIILASVVTPSSPNHTVVAEAFLHQSAAVLGTVLLIHLHSFGQTRVYQLLSRKLFVSIGLISYPIYLWRWPLFSLRSYWLSPETIPWYETLILLLLCFGLSYLTWRWVEQPARNLTIHPSKSLIKFVVITQLLLFIVGVNLWNSDGFLSRFSPSAVAYLESVKDVNLIQKKCHNLLALDSCSFAGLKEESPQFMILGSSLADSVTPAFQELADKYQVKGVQASSDGSPFLVDVQLPNLSRTQNNNREKFHRSALKMIEEQSIQNVFLVGSWAGYIKVGVTSSSNVNSMAAFKEGMEKAVSMLVSKGKRVWIILQPPVIDKSVPRWLALHAAKQSEVWSNREQSEHTTNLRTFFDRLSQQYDVQLLDPMPHLCRADGKCQIVHDGKVVYVDNVHLSASGSLLLSEMLRPAFEIMKQK